MASSRRFWDLRRFPRTWRVCGWLGCWARIWRRVCSAAARLPAWRCWRARWSSWSGCMGSMVHWGWRDVKEEAAGEEPVTDGAGDKGDAGCTFEVEVFNKGDMYDTFGFLIAPEGIWERPCDW